MTQFVATVAMVDALILAVAFISVRAPYPAIACVLVFGVALGVML